MNIYEYKGQHYKAHNKEEVIHHFGLSTTAKNLRLIFKIMTIPRVKPKVKKVKQTGLAKFNSWYEKWFVQYNHNHMSHRTVRDKIAELLDEEKK